MSLSVTKRVWIFSVQSRHTFDWLASQKAAGEPTPSPLSFPDKDVVPPSPPRLTTSTVACLESDTEELCNNVDLYIQMITKIMKIKIKRRM